MVKRWSFPSVDPMAFMRPPRPDEPTTLHSFEGTCSKCGGEHVLDPLPDEPDTVVMASALFDRLPDTVLDRALCSSAEAVLTFALGTFSQFTQMVTKMNPDGPALRAMAEVLDELSDGEASRRWQLYTAEADFLLASFLIRLVEAFPAKIEERFRDLPDVVARFFAYLATTLHAEREHLRETYLGLCADQGRAPDSCVLADGFVNPEVGPMAAWFGWGQVVERLPDLAMPDLWSDLSRRLTPDD